MDGTGYAIVAVVAYVAAGCTKFAANSIRTRKPAVGLIGLGGFPSTHTSIVSAPAFLIALNGGFRTPEIAVAVALCLVVVIDAMDLRKRVETIHLVLKANHPEAPDIQRLRDRVGHTPVEILGGLCVGALSALVVKSVLS